MTILTLIILIAAALLAAEGITRDYQSSIKFIYYGSTEGNKLFKNAQGRFRNVAYLVAHAVLYVPIFVTGIAVPGAGRIVMAGILAALGLVRFFIAKSNEHKNPEKRAEQVAILNSIQVAADPNTPFDQLQSFYRGGRFYYEKFQFLDSTVSIEDARSKVIAFALGGAQFPM